MPESYDLSGLAPSTSYSMAVRGYDEGGNLGGISNVVTATTPTDIIPPATVTDLAAGGETEHAITLSWTAPGDDGSAGQATTYDVRYSMQPITEVKWDAATPVAVPFAPAQAGAHEELTVGSLESRVVYNFALKTSDLAGNLSGLSNVVDLETAGTRTWRVLADGTGDAPTIQAAIELAKDGDLVLVEPGTYYENINLRGKAIHLKGDAGPEVTILDGMYADSSVVMCDSGETNRTIIEGLTITHGKGTVVTPGGGRFGAGILCRGGAPVIRGNIIRANRAESPPGYIWSWGGGVWGYSSTDIIILEDNVIADNFATSNAGGLSLGECQVRRNIIRGNTTGKGDGGGLYIDGPAIIQENLFLENVAADHGGGIYVTNSQATLASEIDISGNVLIANQGLGLDGPGDCSGGAIWIQGAAYVHENTIAFNKASGLDTFLEGGGICLYAPSSDLLVERNVMYRNMGGGLVTIALYGEWEATIRRNLLYENEGEDINNISPSLITLHLEENLFEDPLFCIIGIDSRGDLAGSSPALDQSYGVIGAVAEPGCAPYAGARTGESAWGPLKMRFGSTDTSGPARRSKNQRTRQ